MENNSNNNRTSTNTNSSSITTNSSTASINSTSIVSSSVPTPQSGPVSNIRQSHKRTFAESDSSSRTERHLCSFSHLWIIK